MTEDVHGFEEARLAAYLERQVDGFEGPLRARKFADGQSNPTFLLEAASGKYVLRRQPPGALLASAHAVDREFRVLVALFGTGVPVARPYHLCTDETVIGSWFYIMEYMRGRVFWDPTLPELSRAERRAAYDEMNCILAAIHGVNIEAVGLSDFGKPGSYFARQIARWTKQYRASETEAIPAMERLLEWLPAHVPPDDGRVGLIHGDYRLDNMMFDRTRPEVVAVFDWELSTLGHPIADLAYQCMQWRLRDDWMVRGLAGADLEALGIPTEEEYRAAYCARTGLDVGDDWPFYIAFSFFRLAAICQGVKKRAFDGNASNERAIGVGAMAAPLAELGWREVG